MKKKVPLAPLLLSWIIIVVDQITKALVIKYIPEGRIFARIFGDFVWIVHTRNTGAAFSIGALSPPPLRFLFFIFLPIAVLIILLFYYFKSENLSPMLRYSIGLIAGGGTGNLIDRILRPEGVVDLISVNMYGLLGMERFATFNVADSAITVGEILLILGFLILEFRKPKAQSPQS